jgi:hypothetical protein
MSRLRVWLLRVATMFGLRRSPADLDAELDSHLRLHIDDLVRSGVSPADARRMARLSLGSIEAVRETYRDQDSAPLLRTARETVHQARRAVTRHPAFSAAVIATLGISVGLTASLTGVVDALLFRPPDHVAAPDRLVRVTTANNYPQYERLAAHSRTLDVAAITRRTLSLGSGDTARAIETQCVTASYFPVMGATLAAGRNFSPDEDAPGAPTVVGQGDARFPGAHELCGRGAEAPHDRAVRGEHHHSLHPERRP